MVPRPLVLVVPSAAAGAELPRRLASTGRALAAVYAGKPLDLARAIAETPLLARGLRPWDFGHDALIAARLLEGPHGLRLAAGLPRRRVAQALARTLSELRRAGVAPERLDRLAGLARQSGATAEDVARLEAVAGLYHGFHDALDGRAADPAEVFRAARAGLAEAEWLRGAEVLLVGDLDPDPLAREFLEALAQAFPTRRLGRERPPRLTVSSASGWPSAVALAQWSQTVLAPLAPPPAPAGLARLQERLFEPPAGEAAHDGVELVTAAGEAAEARAIVRRLLREAARGVPFEEMAVLLPRPEPYAPLLSDLLQRLRIPHRLHPSLPLCHGRCARSLLLLFRCRGLPRQEVMEFLTFAPIPFQELLGESVVPRPARWDALSREAGVVSGYERWLIGLRAHAEVEREAAQQDEARRERHLDRAADAEVLLSAVDLLNATLVGLAGEASWAEWAERLGSLLDQWLGPERDRAAVAQVVAELGGLGAVAGGRAAWDEVEQVLEARFDWERLPLEPLGTGAVHVGALDALAGLPFRVVAIPGLVEGGYPPVLRPDPFLLDVERDALGAAEAVPPAAQPRISGGPSRAHAQRGQLSLFDAPEAPASGPVARAPALAACGLRTTQDRLLEARRAFESAVSQATERLILSYPRADPRSGRERMPSLFYAAAASALAGRPLGAAEIAAAVTEDDPAALPLEDAVDAGERDRVRVRRGGPEAVVAVAAGSPFFKGSHLAARERWSDRLTAFDGRVTDLPGALAQRLDPVTAARPVSASSLATYARCGFLYLLKYVLHLEPALEPEERLGLEPLEQGLLFHEVAEQFLRERRDQGALPVRDDDPARERLLAIARDRVARIVANRPPRHRMVWEMRWSAFEDQLLRWLAREAATATRSTPAHFEVAFGSTRGAAANEPHSAQPLQVDLPDGRRLRIAGKIDRIDTRPDGALVLRDYKTGKAPRDDGSVFRGGRELQIPIYVLATRTLFPGRVVAEAFLDYVNAGRPVAFDPQSVAGDAFRNLLGDLATAIAEGAFVQEPDSCNWCDFTAVCGPQRLIEARRHYKQNDPVVRRYLRLRDYR